MTYLLRLFAIFSLLICNIATANDAKPNFIIFVADDMAWNDCGAYGNASVRTPNIDALAAAGLRFDRAYSTCSSCSPSRCSILTGRYPHATGAGELHLPLPAEQTLMTQPLKEAGYWTAAVGKWHLGEAVGSQVDYRQTSSPQAMGDAWVAALKARPTDQPFFLWAAHLDPHRAYQPGAVDPPHDPADVVVPPFLPDTPEVRADLAMYYDEVSRFDEHIGITLAELDRQGLSENTFVLVISDNGRPFPYCKTMVHVPGVRTPFVVRWPAQVAPGGTSNSVVSTVDLAPTILELAGLEPLKSFQGRSLRSVLTNPAAEIREFAFAEHNWHDYAAFERGVHSQNFCYVRNWIEELPGTPPADAVTSPTFKVIQRQRAAGDLSKSHEANFFSTPRPKEFLYDVTLDPDCVNNLANSPSHQETLRTMRTALQTWQTETDDRFPGKDKITPDGFDRDTGKRLITAAHPSLQ